MIFEGLLFLIRKRYFISFFVRIPPFQVTTVVDTKFELRQKNDPRNLLDKILF